MVFDRAAISKQQLDLKRRAHAAIRGLTRASAESGQQDANIRPGPHGRRRQGPGDEFWQFRPAIDGDPSRLIDWRRSARSDSHFVRANELQTTNSILFWADNAAAMQFSGQEGRPEKADRARLIALAATILIVRAGERVGVLGSSSQPHSGPVQVDRMAFELFGGDQPEYGIPPAEPCPAGARLVLLSDFLGPLDEIRDSVSRLASRQAAGALIQLLDPLETSFPFAGRTIFRSMAGRIEFEAQQAASHRKGYASRLDERTAAIAELAGDHGWHSRMHVTGSDVRPVLRWLCGVLEEGL